MIVCQALFSEAWKLFGGHEVDLSGPIFLLLSLSEVILSGGPWRSSIIPYLPKFGKPFLPLFAFLTFCTVLLQKLHPLLTTPPFASFSPFIMYYIVRTGIVSAGYYTMERV